MRKRKSKSKSYGTSYHSLEPRKMLASITLSGSELIIGVNS